MNMQPSIKDLDKELADEPVETLVLPEETLGSLLQRARSAKRLQIDDVAIRLRFKPGVIQAMEDNNFPSLGAPVFARMYLLRYTQLLGLPEHDILARYKALGIDEPPPLRVNPSIKPQARASDLRWLGYPLMFLVLGWLTWTGSQQLSIDPLLQKLGWAEEPVPDTTAQNADTTEPSAMTDTAANLNAVGAELISPMIATDNPVLDFIPDTQDSSTRDTDQTTAPGDTEEPTLSVAAILAQNDADELSNDSSLLLGQADPAIDSTATRLTSGSVTDRSAANPGTSTAVAGTGNSEPISPVSLNDKHELLLEFSDDCWVEIKDNDGERLIYGIVKANEVRTVTGTLPFSIKLGNAHAARLKLDGQEVDKALYIPSRGSVSRFSLENAAAPSNRG